jgi:hypothetical protein
MWQTPLLPDRAEADPVEAGVPLPGVMLVAANVTTGQQNAERRGGELDGGAVDQGRALGLGFRCAFVAQLGMLMSPAQPAGLGAPTSFPRSGSGEHGYHRTRRGHKEEWFRLLPLSP